MQRVMVVESSQISHSAIELEHCDLVLLLDVKLLSHEKVFTMLVEKTRGRHYAIHCRGVALAPFERDRAHALLGFDCLRLNKSGKEIRRVTVKSLPAHCGIPIGEPLSPGELKRRAIWSHDGRNRFIMKQVRALLMPLDGQNQPAVAVVVENDEHKRSLQRLQEKQKLVGLSILKFCELSTWLDTNVIIRADAGFGVPDSLVEAVSQMWSPVVIWDVWDRCHPLLKMWRRQRESKYFELGWKINGRKSDLIEQFLKEHPPREIDYGI